MIAELRNFYKHYTERWPVSYQFVKYNIVGAINTLIDFSVYIGLTRSSGFWQEHFLSANIISFLIANISSFFFNKKFTFRNNSTDVTKQYVKFFIVSIIYLGIVQSLLYLGVHLFQFSDIFAKVIASTVGMFWNFYAHKYWSFRK